MKILLVVLFVCTTAFADGFSKAMERAKAYGLTNIQVFKASNYEFLGIKDGYLCWIEMGSGGDYVYRFRRICTVSDLAKTKTIVKKQPCKDTEDKVPVKAFGGNW